MKSLQNIACSACSSCCDTNAEERWWNIVWSLFILFALYQVLRILNVDSFAPGTSQALSYGGILVIGLVAGTSSCLAVTGGLLLALAAKHNELHRAETAWQKFLPLLHFNVGRLASYFLLGGLVGLLGKSFTLSTTMSGYLNIAVAALMLWLALSLLGLLPKGSFPIRPPKVFVQWIHGLQESGHVAAPLVMGACTFFLPCGFTQSLQLVALASGDSLTGALTMGIFALGTLPSLIGISIVSSTAQGKSSRVFAHFSGTLVAILALVNMQSGLALAGFPVTTGLFRSPETTVSAHVLDTGIQEVRMTVTRYGYEPSNLTIYAGIPVRWMIDGTGATGCTNIMTIPQLGIAQTLHPGENTITFTAQQKGQLAFMCSMGMVRGSFTVL